MVSYFFQGFYFLLTFLYFLHLQRTTMEGSQSTKYISLELVRLWGEHIHKGQLVDDFW